MNKYIAVFLSSFFIVMIPPSLAELQQIRHDPIQADQFTFLVVGDWGRKGDYNQSKIANQMGEVGKDFDIEFVISTGDNFYENGLTGVDDITFNESFTEIYTAESLQKPWYIVLGNHDYMGDVNAQLSPAQSQENRWKCHRLYVVNTGLVDFFLIDTTPLVDSYFRGGGTTFKDNIPDGNRKKYVTNLVTDVLSAMKNSNARWKILVGHHTMLSAGAHGMTVEAFEKLFPLFMQTDIDFYINGHDHCLQLVKMATNRDNGIQFVTSGGGSRAWVNKISTINSAEQKFYYDGEGFLLVRVTEASIYMAFYDIFGNVIHDWTTSKPL